MTFLPQILRSFGHTFRRAAIAPIIFIGVEGQDFFTLGSETQIRGDDGESAVFSNHRKKTRRNNVDSGKGPGLQPLGRPNQLRWLIAAGSPATELAPLVEQKIAGSLALLYGEGSEGLSFKVKLHHAPEIDRAEDIDIMQNERRFLPGMPTRILEKPSGFFQATSGVKQLLLARDFDAHAEVVVLFQVVNHHVGKVMDIDNDVVNPKFAQARERDLEQRAAMDFDQRFGTMVGERPQARAEAGGENHRFH